MLKNVADMQEQDRLAAIEKQKRIKTLMDEADTQNKAALTAKEIARQKEKDED